jgi:transcriptional regulator with XRE-family HTH domain
VRSKPRDDARGLGERIIAVRRKLGLSQREFAERIGVSRNVVIRYESGRSRPRVETLDRIGKVGGVSSEWLLQGNSQQLVRGEDREWVEAVEALRAVWGEPGRRATVVSILRALQRMR